MGGWEEVIGCGRGSTTQERLKSPRRRILRRILHRRKERVSELLLRGLQDGAVSKRKRGPKL